jgi:hypothetical protein
MIGTNWENFLKNQGEWRGSFTRFSPQGELLGSTPSLLSLEAQDNNQLVRFRLRYFDTEDYNQPPSREISEEYRSLGQQIIFFDSGAFSKGSWQLAPFAQFGAEYGFVAENRRLRCVQLFDGDGNFSNLTLIREFRSGSDGYERPKLTLEQLLGEWAGEACTAYPDWQPPTVVATHLEIKKIADSQLQQTLSFGDQRITSTAHIDGDKLYFEGGSTPRQILLLPDGASSNTPLQVKLRQSFFVEVGWLVQPNERQRLIRSYNEKGEWVSATHVIERKLDV